MYQLLLYGGDFCVLSVDNHSTRQYNPEDSSEHQILKCYKYKLHFNLKL
jgi:hypothetical protein